MVPEGDKVKKVTEEAMVVRRDSKVNTILKIIKNL